jgi:hypothetical protein
LCIHHWKTKNRVAIRNTETSKEIKEQKGCWDTFFQKKKTEAKRKKGHERGMAKKKRGER